MEQHIRTPAAGAPAPALDDATMVAIFDNANTVDIETGKLAAERGHSNEVRQFGAMLARDHEMVRQQGRDLANKLGVTPTPPPGDQSAQSVGFHLRHIAGSVDRLFTYARGEPVRDDQLTAMRREGNPCSPPATAKELLVFVDMVIEDAVHRLKEIPQDELLMARAVGRARRPSNVLGLLFHAAEHAQRHAGQVITTSKIIRGLARELTIGSEHDSTP